MNDTFGAVCAILTACALISRTTVPATHRTTAEIASQLWLGETHVGTCYIHVPLQGV